MKIILLLLFFLVSDNLSAQIPSPPGAMQQGKDNSVIFEQVEKEAEFPGGIKAWISYLENNFKVDSVSEIVWKKLPAKVKRQSGTIKITAIVQFIVCKDGSLCEIKTINDVPDAFKAEAERLVAESRIWEPAEQNGRKVKAYRKQPITLQIDVE